MVTAPRRVSEQFAANVASVLDLLEFDREVIDFLIEGPLAAAIGRARQQGYLTMAGPLANAQQVIENIRDNRSLAPKFEKISGQCVVLLVSFFASALKDLFVDNVADALTRVRDTKGLDEELRVPLRALSDHRFHLRDQVGERLVQQKDYQFQDLQSVARAFRSFFGIEIDRDSTTDTIVVAHACRHAIVHNGAVANRRTVSQVRDVGVTDLAVEITDGKELVVAPSDVRTMAAAMRVYVDRLASQIEEVLSGA